MNSLKKTIIDNLKEVYDPEIPVNIYDLGLIYEINIKDSKNVNILMSLTSPTCPTAEYIQTMVEDAVKEVEGVKNVEVELTFEPIWTPDRISKDAKEELGLVENSENNSEILNLFNSKKQEIKEKICFNCAKTDKVLPILSCVYKNEETFICSKCLMKFN